ncbi:hypothetical protein, partial [Candidatus Hakubella thermalkaliphila]
MPSLLRRGATGCFPVLVPDVSAFALGKEARHSQVPPSLEGRCDDATSGFTLVTACEFASPGHARVCRVASTIGVTPYGCTPRYPGEQAIPGVGLSPTSHESST